MASKMKTDLQTEYRKYQNAIENAHDIIYTIDREGNFTDLNRATEDVTGYKREELIGKSYIQVIAPESLAEVLQIFENILKGEKRSPFETIIFSKDGRQIPLEITPYLIWEGGHITEVMGIARDLTEKKQKELEQAKLQQQLARQNLRLSSLYEITQLLNSTLTTQEILQNALAKSIEILSLEGGMIALVNEGTNELRLAAYIAFPGGVDFYQELIERPIRLGEGVSGRVVQTGKLKIIDNFSEGPEAKREITRKAGIKTYICIPIKIRDKCLGVMGLVSRHTKRFDPEDVSLMESIGKGIGAALENARLYTEAKEARDYLNRLIDNSADAILVQDKKGIIIFYSKATEEIYGYKPEEVLGKPISQYYAGGIEDAKKIMRLLEEHGRIRDYEVGFIAKDGTIVPTLAAASVIKDSQGKIISIIGIGRDIREQKRLEEEIRSTRDYLGNLVESSIDGVLTVDNEGRLVFGNKGMQDMFGYTPEESLGRPIHEFFVKGEPEALHIAELLRERGSLKNYELEARYKDGRVILLNCSLSFLKDNNGKVIGTLGIVKDITEQRKLEKQFIENEKMRVLGEMASGVAHNFNNLLAVILGSTQLLTGQDLGSESKRIKTHLERIELASRDGAEMVRRLQEFSRIRQETDFVSLNLNDIVHQAIEITMPRWKDQAQQRGATIHVIPELEDISVVNGNASELREVLTNLLFNAVDALTHGGQILVRTRTVRDQVHLEVKDTGIGMSKKVRDKIFNPFFTTKGSKSTGIGLSVSYGIITRHGGAIDVKSEEGKGTTFVIKLPVAREIRVKEDVIPEIKEIKGANILAIDDEELVLEVLSEMATFLGHRITTASNAKEGLKIFEDSLKVRLPSQRFDMVLTDLGMPGISGWQIAEAIKGLAPDTPLIMITGWQPEIDINKAKEKGVDLLIGKPFEMAKLRQTIEEALEFKKSLSVIKH